MQDEHLLERLNRVVQISAGDPSSDFDLAGDEGRRPAAQLRDASVLVPFVRRGGDWRIILTKRNSMMRHHPGQIAFPGGKRDAADPSIEATALREANEEIGLAPSQVRVIGQISTHETVTGFRVAPVLGMVAPDFQPVPDPSEVGSVFEVPLSHIFDKRNTRIEGRVWQGVERRYFAMPYGPFYIWGATARMIVGLQDLWERTS